MQALYVVSTEGHSGKTLTTLVLMQRYREQGHTPGYLKPIGTAPRHDAGQWRDEDAHLVREQMSLEAPLAQICPLLATPSLLAACLQGAPPPDPALILKAYQALSEKHRPMLIGGSGSALCHGALLGIGAGKVAEMLDARVLVVHPARDLSCLDSALACAFLFSGRTVGVVFNDVPPAMLEVVADVIAPFLERRGVRVLGIVPHDPLLASVTAAELARVIGGTLLTAEGGERPVSAFAVGAMDAERALAVLRAKPGAALLTAVERIDLQLLALEMSTSALVLTGRREPDSRVVAEADARGVPLIASRQDVFDTVALLEGALGRSRLRDAAQLARARSLFAERVALLAIDEALGLN